MENKIDECRFGHVLQRDESRSRRYFFEYMLPPGDMRSCKTPLRHTYLYFGAGSTGQLDARSKSWMILAAHQSRSRRRVNVKKYVYHPSWQGVRLRHLEIAGSAKQLVTIQQRNGSLQTCTMDVFINLTPMSSIMSALPPVLPPATTQLLILSKCENLSLCVQRGSPVERVCF